MKYIVESFVIFREVHVVEADTEESAKFIAKNSDYNASDHISTEVFDVYECNETDMSRFKKKSDYFWDGYTSLDGDSIVYHHKDGILRKEDL